MSELTAEQLQATETMTLDDIRALAEKEAAAPVELSTVPGVRQRDEQGRFLPDNEEDESEEAEEDDEEESSEPAKTIFRKEIANGNGSIDVYEADSLEELVEKLAVGKLNANKQIQEFIAERKLAKTQSEQQSSDDDYVIEQNLKTKPAETIKELAKQALAEEQARLAASNAAQSQFVNTHPDYVADQDNGKRIVAELQRLGFKEFTSESLEKAYQSLKASGLLKLKDVEANDATEDDASATQRTAETKVEPTQQRSLRRSSTISTRTSSRPVATRNTAPTEDEAYKMDLDKLRELANKALQG